MTITVVKECGHAVAGSWSIPSTGEKGYVCWAFDKGKETTTVPWPDLVHCRYCNRDVSREEIQKQWDEPVYYSHADKSCNCGCSYIDSSD